jgi:hypothetical protein
VCSSDLGSVNVLTKKYSFPAVKLDEPIMAILIYNSKKDEFFA